jgi:hypothetical protein
MANYLRSLGVKKGDAVSIYMPMVCELPIAMLACARIGAVHSVVFGGFSAEALAGARRAWRSKGDAGRGDGVSGLSLHCAAQPEPDPRVSPTPPGQQPPPPPQTASPTARPRC